MAEGFLRGLLASRGGGGESIEVRSAGIAGWEGSAATPEAVEAAREREADISGHVARRLSAGMVAEADLVVGLSAEHRDRAMLLVPDAMPRTFTLKEMVRLLDALPPAGQSGDAAERLRARVAEADAVRRSGFERNPFDEDVGDPLGRPAQVYRAVAWEIDELCARLVDGLLGKAPARTSLWGEGE